MLIYSSETEVGDDVKSACYVKSTALAHELGEKGICQAASPLQPTSTATCVRVRQGKPIITDGPFAETYEQLGGYYLIEAANLDEAIAIARRIPAAEFGTVEIRPVLELKGMGDF